MSHRVERHLRESVGNKRVDVLERDWPEEVEDFELVDVFHAVLALACVGGAVDERGDGGVSEDWAGGAIIAGGEDFLQGEL